jgi:hypothetical protein
MRQCPLVGQTTSCISEVNWLLRELILNYYSWSELRLKRSERLLKTSFPLCPLAGLERLLTRFCVILLKGNSSSLVLCVECCSLFIRIDTPFEKKKKRQKSAYMWSISLAHSLSNAARRHIQYWHVDQAPDKKSPSLQMLIRCIREANKKSEIGRELRGMEKKSVVWKVCRRLETPNYIACCRGISPTALLAQWRESWPHWRFAFQTLFSDSLSGLYADLFVTQIERFFS